MSGNETGKSDVRRCAHCLLEMKGEPAVTAGFDGETKYFCCQGCLRVYELIHKESLDTFYSSRCGWTPGPPEKAVVKPGAFKDTVRKYGTTSSLDMVLSGIRCASCVWLVEKYLMKMGGMVSARVNYATHRLTVQWEDQKHSLNEILEGIRSIGYAPHPYHPTAFSAALVREKNDLLLRFGTAAFFSMQLMLFVAALYAGFFQGIEAEYRRTFQLIAWALATPVLFYSGYPFLKNSVRAVLRRSLSMDVLIALGSVSSYAYSIVMIFTGGEVYFDTSAMIVTFILLGRFLEAGSKLKAGNTLSLLIEMQSGEARLLTDSGETRLVPLEELSPGNTIEVRAGEKFPLDGMVVEGEADVDESVLTGESKPVFKSREEEVFAGTISLNGRLAVRVSAGKNDTVLSRIIRTVKDAQSRKAPIQTIADRTAGYFVPLVVFFAFLSFAYWMVTTADISVSLMNAVSVLVVACPCALGLAAPLAILMGTSSAARNGILVKGGDIFETVSRTDCVVLDKTGTITDGDMSVTDVVSMTTQDALLGYAASIEKYSEHPAGRAIVSEYSGTLFPVEGFRVISGKGVSGMVNARSCLAGNRDFMAENSVVVPQEQDVLFEKLAGSGKTVVFIAVDKIYAGMIGMIDDVRNDAAALVSGLMDRGIRVSMLTGDTRQVARYVAGRCGIKDIRAGLNPMEKADVIRTMSLEGNRIIMVGDGINDAPALTEADTGVTLGHASDIALESAGVVVMQDNLGLITALIDGSRRCFTVIRQNLFWAFSYNLVAIPLAIAGFLHPIMSAFLMACSSLVVVGNAMRLRKF